MIFFLSAVIGYLFGSIPFGLVLSKLFGYGDIRKIGSGNIGATNVLRTGNKKLAALTLILDASKGAIPIFIAMVVIYFDSKRQCKAAFNAGIDCFSSLISFSSIYSHSHYVLLIIGFAAVIGHMYPVWLRFKGGKGVATTLGTLLAAVPVAGLIACGMWLATAIVTRISSLSALMAVLVAPVAVWFFYGAEPTLVCCLITLLVWFKHRSNIKRLLKGEEPKIGKKKP